MWAQISITGLTLFLVISNVANLLLRYAIMKMSKWTNMPLHSSITPTLFTSIQAANIFYYLTYEGAVDLENMDDMLQKSAIEDQIANFGQTPIQIFRKKHPRRGPPIPIAHPLYFAPASISLTLCVNNVVNAASALLFVGLVDSDIILVNQDLTLSVKIWLSSSLQANGSLTFSGNLVIF